MKTILIIFSLFYLIGVITMVIGYFGAERVSDDYTNSDSEGRDMRV